MNFVYIYGSINSNYDINNGYINIYNSTYDSSPIPDNECITLSGNIDIDNSKFFGSKCNLYTINFNGLDKYSFSLKNSYISGEYRSSCLIINQGLSVNIDASTFEKGYSSLDKDGGAGIKINNSKTNIKNCKFKDIVSEKEGAALFLEDIYDFSAEYIETYNCSAFYAGSVAFIRSELTSKPLTKFKNIRQINTGNMDGLKHGGLIMAIRSQASVDIENFYGENIISYSGQGCAFTLNENTSLNIRNIELNNMRGNATDGLFLNTIDPIDINISVTNATLYDFYQYREKINASFLWFNHNTNAVLKNIKIAKSGGYNSRFIYVSDHCNLTIDNLEIDGFYSKNLNEFINISSPSLSDDDYIKLSNIKIRNITSQGPIIVSEYYKIIINDIDINSIHLCNIDNSCNNNRDEKKTYVNTDIFHLGKETDIEINNAFLTNIYGYKAIDSLEGANAKMTNITFTDSYFSNGIIEIDNDNSIFGNYYIDNIYCKNITSINGSILNIKSIDEKLNNKVTIINSNFESNTATNYGGVIFSISPFTKNFVFFENCNFSNNRAKNGDVAFSLNKDSEPNFSNINDLKEIKGLLGTNPTKLKLDSNIPNKFSIFSGDKIPEGIKCKIFDDYDNQIHLNSDLSSMGLDDIISFFIEIEDELNTELIGLKQSYCWNDECAFPSIKVTGNPGNYTMKLKLNTYGQYYPFENDFIYIDFEIKNCDTESETLRYINQNTDSSNFKSCYLPICNPECKNNGYCINNNLCDCSNTLYTGNICDEHFKMERLYFYDYTIRTFSNFLTLVSFIIMLLILYLRNEPIIKAGSIDFMIIILIGIIINLTYAFLLTVERTEKLCYINFILNYMGFALVFGSILIKTLRVYRIFCFGKGTKRGISQNKMYLMLLSLVSLYLFFVLMYFIFGKIKFVSDLTTDHKEYYKCVYPNSKIICIIINFIILGIGSYLSYSIRNINEKFKENLVVPVYVYVLFMSINQMIELINDIPLLVQDLIAAMGTILNTSVILIYLFISKFYSLYIFYTIGLERSSVRSPGSSLNKYNSVEALKQKGKSGSNIIKASNSNDYIKAGLYGSNNSLQGFQASQNSFDGIDKIKQKSKLNIQI